MFMFHSCAIVIATVIQNRDMVCNDPIDFFVILLLMGIHSLRDDFTNTRIGGDENRVIRSVHFSHILFVLENFFMILMSYFTYNPGLVLFTCHCVCLCVQCSWLHNENLLITLA